MDQPQDKRRLWFWWIVFVILAGLLATLVSHIHVVRQVAETSQPGLYKVAKFDDGDTIVVDMNGVDETVRFIGVDTPETHHPKMPLQCYGQKASDFTKQLIGNQRVRLQADSLDTNRDRYGRLLRYVYLPDGTLVDKKLIEEGYGFAYTFFPFEKSQEFSATEAIAKQAKKGLWGACQIIINGTQRHTAPAQ